MPWLDQAVQRFHRRMREIRDFVRGVERLRRTGHRLGRIAGVVAHGARPGRERPDETILFWHRGLSLSDIALGHAMLEKARRLGIGQQLRYA